MEFRERVEISGANVEKGREKGHLGIFINALVIRWVAFYPFFVEQKNQRLILQLLGLLSLALLGLLRILAIRCCCKTVTMVTYSVAKMITR